MSMELCDYKRVNDASYRRGNNLPCPAIHRHGGHASGPVCKNNNGQIPNSKMHSGLDRYSLTQPTHMCEHAYGTRVARTRHKPHCNKSWVVYTHVASTVANTTRVCALSCCADALHGRLTMPHKHKRPKREHRAHIYTCLYFKT